jgi:ribosomal protein S18 acetylase RimI-like enzyme
MLNTGIIRRFTNDDFNHIISLEHRCFDQQTAYTPAQLRYLLHSARSTSLVESWNNTIRGFIIVLSRKRSSTACVETLNVDPIYQGRGIGKKLLYAAEENLVERGIDRLCLEVSTRNHPAIRLYEGIGFQKTSYLPLYYLYKHHGTRNAYRMMKELST